MRTLAYLLVTLLPLTAAGAPRTPRVVSDVAGQDSCYQGDPYGPCRGRVIKVRNPHRTRTYYVRLGCGEPSLTSVAFIPPRRTAVFDLRWGGPGSLLRGQCRIQNVVWYPALDRRRGNKIRRR